MGDYNASFWGPEQNKIEKLRKQSTPKIAISEEWAQLDDKGIIFFQYCC